MTDLRQAAEQAREALKKAEPYVSAHKNGWISTGVAMDSRKVLGSMSAALASLEEALSSPAAPIEAATLHQQIMNLPDSGPALLAHMTPEQAYTLGARNARHAAAELVLASSPREAAQTSARPPDATPDEWVDAVRQVYLSARASPTTGRIPSSWLEFMRDKLLSSAPPAAATVGLEYELDGVIDDYERTGRMDSVSLATLKRVRAALSTPTEGGELPVAVRYKNSNGRWRYINFPFTKGWEFPEQLGKLEKLYLARPTPAAAGVPPGYVLVPREPTMDMLAAAERELDRMHWDRVDAGLWTAMLAASGAPAGAPTEGEQQK